MLREKSVNQFGTGGTGFFEHGATTHNFFDSLQKYVKMHTQGIVKVDSVNSILKHRKLIDRCFWPDSVEAIMDNLRRETEPIAKQILDKMESNSLLSMKIALKMLR